MSREITVTFKIKNKKIYGENIIETIQISPEITFKNALKELRENLLSYSLVNDSFYLFECNNKTINDFSQKIGKIANGNEKITINGTFRKIDIEVEINLLNDKNKENGEIIKINDRDANEQILSIHEYIFDKIKNKYFLLNLSDSVLTYNKNRIDPIIRLNDCLCELVGSGIDFPKTKKIKLGVEVKIREITITFRGPPKNAILAEITVPRNATINEAFKKVGIPELINNYSCWKCGNKKIENFNQEIQELIERNYFINFDADIYTVNVEINLPNNKKITKNDVYANESIKQIRYYIIKQIDQKNVPLNNIVLKYNEKKLTDNEYKGCLFGLDGGKIKFSTTKEIKFEVEIKAK